MVMNRISEPLTKYEQKEFDYDAVVIGSGYGGGIAASRLARARKREPEHAKPSVCVLERGAELVPGDYPTDWQSGSRQIQARTKHGHIGRADAMFEFHVNREIIALVGCGLGGTSLINANVLMKMDTRLFQENAWPKEFQADPHLLDPYYERSRTVLDAQRYPDGERSLNKLAALEEAGAYLHVYNHDKYLKHSPSTAALTGRTEPPDDISLFERPLISVNFRHQVNRFGVKQARCVGCGDCVTGCNYGAKNTTLMNYLPDAKHHGADIFTLATVRYLERIGEKWHVHVATTKAAGVETKTFVFRADVVVLAAGTLGSTGILLRSREHGLSLSPQLGQRFSGNGDSLAFGYNSDWRREGNARKPIYGIGVGSNVVDRSKYPGPCITGAIKLRNDEAAKDSIVIEEGVTPGALSGLLPPVYLFAATLFARFFRYGVKQAEERLLDVKALGEAVQESSRDLTELCYEGPMSRTQTYLVMGVDSAGGRIRLNQSRDDVRIDWPDAGRDRAIRAGIESVANANTGLKGQLINNLLWTPEFGERLVTVHPVGGCSMADDAAGGVVNHKCGVFSGNSGTETHPGLYVCDGAVMPGAVGANPLWTICAVVERACDLLVADLGWAGDDSVNEPQELPTAGVRAAAWRTIGFAHVLWRKLEGLLLAIGKKLLRRLLFQGPGYFRVGLRFSETMEGYVSAAEVDRGAARLSDRYELATEIGKRMGQSMSFDVTIDSDDMCRLLREKNHPADVSGTVACSMLSHEPMNVKSEKDGFHLLEVFEDGVETWKMTYSMCLQRKGGSDLRLEGVKHIRRGTGGRWWKDLTTLDVQVFDKGSVVAMGTLALDFEDFLRQARTVKQYVHARGVVGELLNRFGKVREAAKLLLLLEFAKAFGETMFRAYGGLLANIENYFKKESESRERRRLQVKGNQIGEPERFPIRTPTGTQLLLTRYRYGERPVILAPGFAVNASSFAIDTVKTNLVEYLADKGCDVWLFDYRASPDSGSSRTDFTIDDIAKEDWPTAVDFVLEKSGNSQLQVIAHCVGSMTLLMALLGKSLSKDKLRSIICSQLTLHPVTNWLNYAKADIKLAKILENLQEIGKYFGVDIKFTRQKSIDIRSSDELRDKAMNALLFNVPVPNGEECNNPVCHRISSIFGPSYTHSQLNHDTHVALCEMFDGISIEPLKQLALIVRYGYAVDKDGENAYVTDANAPQLDLPISFIAGSHNQIFFPQTSLRTYEWLCAHNSAKNYDRHVFNGYAHLDCFIGKNAHEHVYGYLWEKLQNPPS